MNTMNNKIELFFAALDKKIKILSDYSTEDRKVKYSHEKQEGSPYSNNFNDENWKDIELPYSWPHEKEVWFRKKITVPRIVKNISVEGSRLEIGGSGYFANAIVLAHGELYIDGNKIMEAQNWTDFRYRYIISDNVNPGDEHLIAVHFYRRKDYMDACSRKFNPLEIHLSKVDELFIELELFLEELRFIFTFIESEKIIEKIGGELDILKLESLDIFRLQKYLENLEAKFIGFSPLAKKHVVKLIGNAHIDMNWLWPMDETEDIIKDTFTTVFKLMEKYPKFHFSQSQAKIYEITEKKHPSLFNKITEKVKQNRWEITATSWVELDTNMSYGESIVRQIIYAKKYIKDKFNFEPKIFWASDTFGHPSCMPQILAKSGLKYYYFMRASNRDDDLFWWKGIDGSVVMAFNSQYIGEIKARDICELVKIVKNKQGSELSMFVYGVGDHGGGPTKKDIEMAQKINQKPLLPKLEFNSMHNYFNEISLKKLNLPIREQEFNPVFDGCYTTHWDTKLHNRECQRLLIESEITGVLSSICGNSYMKLEKQWKNTLFNQFHDILSGSSVKPSYDYSNKLAEETEIFTKDIIFKNLNYLSTKIKLEESGIPVMVFNTLSWERTEVANIEIEDEFPKDLMVLDSNGEECPWQKFEGKLFFLARDVPSLGYEIFYISEGRPGKSFEDDSLVKQGRMENDFLELEVDPETGIISYLYDKLNNKLVTKLRLDEGTESDNAFPQKLKVFCNNNSYPITKTNPNNLIQLFFEKPHSQSAWVIGPISRIINLMDKAEIEVMANGPIMGSIRVKRKFSKSTIIQDIKIYQGMDRIDFYTTIDWQESSSPEIEAPMLKASFTPILGKTSTRFEIPFGNLERVADGREYPALNWVDVSDDNYGFSILSDCKHGFDVQGNTLRITLIRTSYEPDPDPDKGSHSFTYAIYPHKYDFKKSNVVKRGYELNYPLKVLVIKDRGSNNAEMTSKKSFITVDNAQVILSVLKKAENNHNLIARFYESKGSEAQTRVNLNFKFKKVEEVNLMEEKLELSVSSDNLGFDFKIKPFEIKTFKIYLN